MSRTAYLVRLRSAHRFYEDEPPARQVIRSARDVEALFLRREDAEAYTRTQVPIYANPFGLGYELHLYNGEELELYHEVFSRCYGQPFYPNIYGRNRVLVSEYCEQVRQVGLLLPEEPQEYTTSDWSLWWYRATRHMSFDEKKTLKNRLPIAAIYTNPLAWTTIVPAPEYNDRWIEFTRLHEFTRAELDACMAPLCLSLESDTSSKQLHTWWERHKDRLTNTQRMDIWNLVDPYPYEVVEVELV